MRSESRSTLGIAAALTAAALLGPATASAWTTAKLAQVDVALAVAPRGESQVTTQARFEVQGGKFHGFTLAPLPGAELVAPECRAASGDGRALPLVFSPLPDGRMRILLADGAAVGYGAVTYTLVHRIDLVAAGALRRYDGGRARLEWTPLSWDGGTDAMTVDVLLPGESPASPPSAESTVNEDYEAEAGPAGVRLTKFRTVRWYAMRVAVDFDAGLVPGLRAARERAEAAPAAAATEPPADPAAVKRPPPPLVALAPALAALAGFGLKLRKAGRTRRAVRDLGLEARFLLLPGAGAALRFALSAAAVALGLGAQAAGSTAAGIPALAAAVCLWMVRREAGPAAARAGGTFREMGEEDVVRYQRLCREYSRRRASLLDVTTGPGFLAFAAALAGLGAAFAATCETWPRIALATVLDGAIWIVPAWFTNNRAELPVDPALESFISLRRWRRALDRLVGARLGGAAASFWVREDEAGPIEVRLRVGQPLPDGVRAIEIANELVRRGAALHRRSAVVLRLEPGSELSRRLSSCPNAAEHHLTPDLAEEILVLRNRRGKAVEGLAPLRAALARIGS